MKSKKTTKTLGNLPKKFFDENNLHLVKNFSEIAEVVSLINRVDIKSMQAKININSISDNNGNRIIL